MSAAAATDSSLTILRLTEDERAERGLRVTPELDGCRPATTARAEAIAQSKAAAQEKAQAAGNERAVVRTLVYHI